MPHMLGIERRGMERGRAEGRVEGQAEMLLYAVEKHFGTALPEDLAGRIRQTQDTALLKLWLEWAYASSSLEEFQQRLQKPPET